MLVDSRDFAHIAILSHYHIGLAFSKEALRTRSKCNTSSAVSVRTSWDRVSNSSMSSTSSRSPDSRKSSTSSRTSASPPQSHRRPAIDLETTHSYTAQSTSNSPHSDVDVGTRDFDFEDIFTYDKPQKKLSRCVEVSSPSKERDWSSFSFSHYTPAMAARSKVNGKVRASVGETYLRNQQQKTSTSSRR